MSQIKAPNIDHRMVASSRISSSAKSPPISCFSSFESDQKRLPSGMVGLVSSLRSVARVIQDAAEASFVADRARLFNVAILAEVGLERFLESAPERNRSRQVRRCALDRNVAPRGEPARPRLVDSAL
jgi:hypothetical protein